MARRRRSSSGRAHPVALAVLAVAGLVLLVAAGSVLWGVWTRSRPGARGSAEIAGEETRPLTVEVLDGEGGAGSAGEVAAELREAGFTVTRTGRADRRDYHGLLVVARTEAPAGVERAGRVAASLGTDRVILQRAVDPAADVQVIVGAPASR